MNRALSLVLCVFLVQLTFGQWSEMPVFPGLDRDDALALSSENEAIFFTGNHGGFEESNKVYLYDVLSKSWGESTAFPGPKRQYAGGFVIKRKAYVFCGLDENSQGLKDVWCYDFSTRSWNKKNDFPGDSRWSFGAFSLHGKGYLVGGTDYNDRVAEVWQYHPGADTWQRKKDFPGGKRRENIAMTIRDKGYVGLGFDTFDEVGFKSDFWAYNSVSDSWLQLPDFPGGKRAYAQAEGGMNLGFVGTGINPSQEFQSDIYSWNSDLLQWVKLEDINEKGSRGCSSFSAGGQVFWLTGLKEGNQRETKLYRYQTNTYDIIANVYPNPSEKVIHIVGNPFEVFVIYNWMGQEVLMLTLDDKGFFQLENLESGIYLARSISSLSQTLLKLIVN